MIYLIKSYFKGGKYAYKIGYSSDVSTRLKQYFYMNPGFEVTALREGDAILESLLHKYLYAKGLRYQKGGRLDEWFCPDSEVQRIFHISRESLEAKLWRNRDQYFDSSKVGDPVKEENKIFLYLWEKNKDSFCGEEFRISGKDVVKLNTPKVDIVFRRYLLREGKIEIPTPDASKTIILEVQKFLDNKFYNTGNFQEKLKMYCKFVDRYEKSFRQELQELLYFKIKDDRFRTYYNFFGSSGCSNKQYREDRLREDLLKIPTERELCVSIKDKFELGKSYTFKDIKVLLGSLYRSLGIQRKPKATDLKKYFKLTRTRLRRDGKENGGFKLYEL